MRARESGRFSPYCAASQPDLGDLYTERGKTLKGSFQAVSKPNFIINYKSLCLLLTTTKTSRRLCLLLEGVQKKLKTVVGESSRGLFFKK